MNEENLKKCIELSTAIKARQKELTNYSYSKSTCLEFRENFNSDINPNMRFTLKQEQCQVLYQLSRLMAEGNLKQLTSDFEAL